MADTIKLQGIKPSKLTFNMDVTGVEKADCLTYFVIEAETMRVCFPCKKRKDVWTASIPALPFLELDKTYDCYVEVIIDNYYFQPFKTKCKITGAPLIAITDPTEESVLPTIEVKGNFVVEEEEVAPEPDEANEDARALEFASKDDDEAFLQTMKEELHEEEPVTPINISFSDVVKTTANKEESAAKKKRVNETLQKALKG